MILKLLTETIHGICSLLKDKDLCNLLLIKCALASIAAPIYTAHLGIWKEVESPTFALEGESFWALGTWKRSRLFTHLKYGIQLYCTINHWNWQLAVAQVHCLCTFLSTDLPSTPFSSIIINGVCHMNPSKIADFICLIHKVGCCNATIMSPYNSYKHPPSDTTSSCPTVTLSNLVCLELDTSHFVDWEWLQFLQCLTCSKLVSLSVHGPPPSISLFHFLAWHPGLESLKSYSCWTHFTCIPSSSFLHKIVWMPHLERLDGPPSHLQAIVKPLSQVPKALAVQFSPDPDQSYGAYVTKILHTVCLCDRMDSKLDVSIHFRECHFTLHNYKFDVVAMDVLGAKCPSNKSLYLFLPTIKEQDVLVSLVVSQHFCILIHISVLGYLYTMAMYMACVDRYSSSSQHSKTRVDCRLSCSVLLRMGFVFAHQVWCGHWMAGQHDFEMMYITILLIASPPFYCLLMSVTTPLPYHLILIPQFCWLPWCAGSLTFLFDTSSHCILYIYI